MDNENYFAILPAQYYGYKIKYQSITIGQLPSLEMAIDRAKNLLQSYKTNKIIVFNEKHEIVQKILL